MQIDWNQAFSTLIGALLGFLLSLILYWYKERRERKNKEKQITNNVILELNLLVSFLGTVDQHISDVSTRINSDIRPVFTWINYSRMINFHINQYYQSGLIRMVLSPVNIRKLDETLTWFNTPYGNELNRQAIEWNEGRKTKGDLIEIYGIERQKISEAIEFLGEIKDKVAESLTQ